MGKLRTLQDYFYDYLEKYGGDADTFDYGEGEVVLSFAGSDGPEIKSNGIDSELGLIEFDDTEILDEYIKDCCKNNYGTLFEGHIPVYPSKTWTEYYNEKVKVL